MKTISPFERIHSINALTVLVVMAGLMEVGAIETIAQLELMIVKLAITALTGNVAVVVLNNSILMIVFPDKIFIIAFTLMPTMIATMTLIALAGNIAVVFTNGILFMIAFSGRIFTIVTTFIPSMIATITTIARADFSAIAGITGNDAITGLYFGNGIAVMTACMNNISIVVIFIIIADVSNMVIATIIAIIDIHPIYCT